MIRAASGGRPGAFSTPIRMAAPGDYPIPSAYGVIRAMQRGLRPARPAAWSNYCEFPMRLLVLVSILAFVAGPAHADATQDALAEIVKCAGIAEASERLKCFDTAAPRAKSALAEQEAKEKRGILDWFGFSRPRKPVTKPEEFGKPQPPTPAGEIREITSTVVEFATTPRGKALFILENGQVWRQLDGDDTRVLEPLPGKAMKVTIELGFLESYNLLIEGRKGLIKVRRLK